VRKIFILLVALLVALIMAVPAFAHVHFFNPSDECSNGKVPVGVTNPGGKDVPAQPNANGAAAFANCKNAR
jgi:uncharacterized protein YcnI